VIIDPHVAVIRVPEAAGPALYDGVMRRVAERSEQPQGVLMHFTTIWSESFIVGTVFRDSASMLDGFIGYSAPEAQNEMVATGRPTDMSRSEFQLERMYVEAAVEPHAFSYVPADGMVAFTSDAFLPSIETYREVSNQQGHFDTPAEGRVAHIAHHSPDGVRLMTFWRSRELGERWNEQHVYGRLSELEPGKVTEEKIDASWLDIVTFLVTVDNADPTRDFVRESAGPSRI
jgi:hypothetical protein